MLRLRVCHLVNNCGGRRSHVAAGGLPCVRHSSGSGSGSGSAAAASVPVAQPSRGVAAAATPQQYGAAAGGSNGSTFRGRTVEELEAWMERHGVDIHVYGRGAARTTHELLQEVQNAESVLTVLQLAGGAVRALRLVSVLNLYIRNAAGQVLIEASQRLPDGRVRQRGLPLSEKMIGHEGWRDAALRAVAEELDTALRSEPDWRSQLTLDESSYRQLVEMQESTSYPGLLTQYTCHKVNAELPCLPDGAFSTDEPRPGGALTNYWEWRDPSPAVAAVMSTQDLGP